MAIIIFKAVAESNRNTQNEIAKKELDAKLEANGQKALIQLAKETLEKEGYTIATMNEYYSETSGHIKGAAITMYIKKNDEYVGRVYQNLHENLYRQQHSELDMKKMLKGWGYDDGRGALFLCTARSTPNEAPEWYNLIKHLF